MIEDLKKESHPIIQVELGPLKEQYIEELCSETFKKPLKEVSELSKVLEDKTNGNPFFLKAFLQNMYETDLVTFSEEAGWQWNIDKILAQPITENVAVLISSIINRFDEKTRELIIEGSFLGNVFNKNICKSNYKNKLSETLYFHNYLDCSIGVLFFFLDRIASVNCFNFCGYDSCISGC